MSIINITALDKIVYFSKTIYLFLKQFIFIVEELISLLKCIYYWLWACQSNMCDRQNMLRIFSDSCNVWKIFWSKLSIVQISWDYNKVTDFCTKLKHALFESHIDNCIDKEVVIFDSTCTYQVCNKTLILTEVLKL